MDAHLLLGFTMTTPIATETEFSKVKLTKIISAYIVDKRERGDTNFSVYNRATKTRNMGTDSLTEALLYAYSASNILRAIFYDDDDNGGLGHEIAYQEIH